MPPRQRSTGSTTQASERSTIGGVAPAAEVTWAGIHGCGWGHGVAGDHPHGCRFDAAAVTGSHASRSRAHCASTSGPPKRRSVSAQEASSPVRK